MLRTGEGASLRRFPITQVDCLLPSEGWKKVPKGDEGSFRVPNSPLLSSWPCPVTAIFFGGSKEDTRNKSGHDEKENTSPLPHPEVRARRASKGAPAAGRFEALRAAGHLSVRESIAPCPSPRRTPGSMAGMDSGLRRNDGHTHLSPCGRGRHAAGVTGEGVVQPKKPSQPSALKDPPPAARSARRPPPRGGRYRI